MLEELESRGLVHDTTDRDLLAQRLSGDQIAVYHGIDPTASSLHLGNLIGGSGAAAVPRSRASAHRPGGRGNRHGGRSQRAVRRAQSAGRRHAGRQPVRAYEASLSSCWNFDGDAELVNNYDWTRDLTLIEFLRDTGKHATVNQMAAKHSVRSRMESETGISFTEFTYMLLQAYDYWWLHTNLQCELQIGGSDQWGNITAGVDLIRRRSGVQVHGLTWPLLTRSDGAKFGKTAEGAVWLDPERTSPYRFHQYFVQVPDEDVERSLRQFTMLPVAEIAEVVEAHRRDPGRREAQRTLANEVTSLVHGPAAAVAAEEAAGILFGSPVGDMDEAAFEVVAAEVPTSNVSLTPDDGFDAASNSFDLVELLASTGLASSKGDARRGLSEGSVYVNNERVSGDAPMVAADRLLHSRYLLLRRGKRRHHLLRVRNP